MLELGLLDFEGFKCYLSTASRKELQKVKYKHSEFFFHGRNLWLVALQRQLLHLRMEEGGGL